MIIWYRILKEDKLVLFLQVGLIILLLSAISITPCFSSSPTLTTIIGILCSIIGSIITATIIVYFTISKSLIIPIKWTFEKLHSDIFSNAETLSLFPDQCEELKNNWLNGNSTGFYSESGRKWLPKFSAESYNPENSVKYSWRYLKIGNYPILYDNQKLSEIEGLGFKSDKISQFWGYPQLCHQFCDYIQP